MTAEEFEAERKELQAKITEMSDEAKKLIQKIETRQQTYNKALEEISKMQELCRIAASYEER